MKNHFHLCIQVKKQKVQQHFDVSKKFSNLFNAYTKTINKHYNRTGSLFETPFKRKNTIVSCTKITEWFGDINVFIKYHKNYQKEVMNLSSFD
jgi:hypothetical protein